MGKAFDIDAAKRRRDRLDARIKRAEARERSLERKARTAALIVAGQLVESHVPGGWLATEFSGVAFVLIMNRARIARCTCDALPPRDALRRLRAFQGSAGLPRVQGADRVHALCTLGGVIVSILGGDWRSVDFAELATALDEMDEHLREMTVTRGIGRDEAAARLSAFEHENRIGKLLRWDSDGVPSELGPLIREFDVPQGGV